MAIRTAASKDGDPIPAPQSQSQDGSASGDAARPRFAALDLARGIAIIAMAVYHFSWDLRDYHLVSWDVASGPLWRLFARSIASTFLIIVGISLVLATRNGFRPRPFFRRLAILVAAAALVSLGTWWFAGDAFAFFGILHLIAVGSVLALPFLYLPSWLAIAAAVVAVAAPYYLASPFFDAPAWWWLGLVTEAPRSVDYVPVLPWIAPILVGIVAGRLILRHLSGKAIAFWHPHTPVTRLIAAAGRWSLPIYLVHQPLLVGLVSLAATLLPPNPAVESRIFMSECSASCAAAGRDGPFCAAYCNCAHTGMEGTDLMTIGRSEMTADQSARWNAIIGQCREDSATPFEGDTSPAPAP
jgi:uncharacterized membrane protein